MDNTEKFRCLSLCSGYAGIELGLRRVISNLRTVAYVEVEAFACANLAAKIEAGLLDAAPIWTDIKTFDAESFQDRVHIITAGYPCQPFSVAGKRKGTDDPRHLWPYIERIIKAVRPVWFFGENVAGHLALGYPEVYRSLRDMGYKVEAGLFTAAECGAPQRRKRLFIVAQRNNSGRFVSKSIDLKNEVPNNGSWNTTKNIGDWFGWKRWLIEVCKNDNGVISRSDFYRMDEWDSKKLDRLRLLGNGVVPQQAEKAFRNLMRLFE